MLTIIGQQNVSTLLTSDNSNSWQQIPQNLGLATNLATSTQPTDINELINEENHQHGTNITISVSSLLNKRSREDDQYIILN